MLILRHLDNDSLELLLCSISIVLGQDADKHTILNVRYPEPICGPLGSVVASSPVELNVRDIGPTVALDGRHVMIVQRAALHDREAIVPNTPASRVEEDHRVLAAQLIAWVHSG